MGKFAVYSSETGLYCYKYADTVEALQGSGFENIITEDRLPVVFDGKGGYFAFDPKDHNFVEIIESDKEVPLPLEKMFYKNHPTAGLDVTRGDTTHAAIPTTPSVLLCWLHVSSEGMFPELALTEPAGSR